jgi:two-component system, OmpR family, response regulator
MANILAIEANPHNVSELVVSLLASRHVVDVASTGREGMAKAMGCEYDLITIERNLPDFDGIRILTTIRSVRITTPILVMSVSSDIADRVEGLRAGGDDYLSKPFSTEELVARVDALLRRSLAAQAETSLKSGNVNLDLLSHKVTCRGRQLQLRPTEFRLLEFLMRHPNTVLSRTAIFEAVWGREAGSQTNLIDVHVGRLRKKVGLRGMEPAIRTIRGAGYMFG